MNAQHLAEVCMKKAIRSLPNHDLRDAYEEAVRAAPHVVRSESRALDFLILEDYDVPAAATRLCRYWQARKQVFADRWLLPLTQTGQGALSPSDCEILRTGFFHYFPATAPDQRNLVVIDNAKLPVLSAAVVTRVIFYVLHVFRDTNMNGLNMVRIISSKPPPPLDIEEMQGRYIPVHHNALPANLSNQTVFVTQVYEPYKKELLDYLAYQQFRISQNRQRKNPKVKVHLLAGNGISHTRQLLEQNGLDLNALPPALGGKCSHDYHYKWIRQRLSVEGALHGAPPIANRIPASLVGDGTVVSDAVTTLALPAAAATASISEAAEGSFLDNFGADDWTAPTSAGASRPRKKKQRRGQETLKEEMDSAKALEKAYKKNPSVETGRKVFQAWDAFYDKVDEIGYGALADGAPRKFFTNRRQNKAAMMSCIRNCLGGNASAFFEELKCFPGVYGKIYCCTHLQSSADPPS